MFWRTLLAYSYCYFRAASLGYMKGSIFLFWPIQNKL